MVERIGFHQYLWTVYSAFNVADTTRKLQAIETGDSAAAHELLPMIYAELRQLAKQRLANEGAGHTLQATALVHEAYLRLVGTDRSQEVKWDGPAHFFAAAAEAMRRILIDHARAKSALKRGGGHRVELSNELCYEMPPEEFLHLNDAIDLLQQDEPIKAELVKLRFFAGVTMQQAADALGISRTTANRHWIYAKAWLYGHLQLYRKKTVFSETDQP